MPNRAATIRPDIHARFLELLKRVERQNSEARAEHARAVARAVARAAAQKNGSAVGTPWRKHRTIGLVAWRNHVA